MEKHGRNETTKVFAMKGWSFLVFLEKAMARILDPLHASLEFSMMVVLKQTTFLPQQTTLASPISIRMENAWACQFLLEYTLLYPPLSEYILAYPVLLGYVRTVLTPMISTTKPAERASRSGFDL